jgi:hypothetical protein
MVDIQVPFESGRVEEGSGPVERTTARPEGFTRDEKFFGDWLDALA